jgi:MFS family permease
MNKHWKIIGILAITQIAAWGSLYYAFAVIAPKIVAEMGWTPQLVFGAFSWSLLVAGFVATPVGIILDRFGGRVVMSVGSAVCGAGLILLGSATSMAVYVAAWTILGLAMTLTLYEPAFATINRQIDTNSRKAISTLTLFGGFASTVFWPLTLMLETKMGWRNTYVLFGIIQLVICLPLHLMLGKPAPRAPKGNAGGVKNYTLSEACRHPAFWKLALAFAANSFIFSAMSVHLIWLFQHFGHAAAVAVFMAALIGPMQVVGRLGEMTFARFLTPQMVGKLAFSVLPGALLALTALGAHQIVLALFCVAYGLSNGVLTIVRGTLPQALFGKENYGAISGALSGPSLAAKAAGPVVIAALVSATDSAQYVLIVFTLFSIASMVFYFAAVRADRH